MRVLVVKLSALGDVVQGLVALGRVRRLAPADLEVEWAVDGRFAGLVEGHPWIARVHPVDFGGWLRGRGLTGARDALAALRARPFDLVVDLQGRLKSRIIGLAAGAPRRVAYSRSEAVNPWRAGRGYAPPGAPHAVDEYTRVLAAGLSVSMPVGGWVEPQAPLFPVRSEEAARLDRVLAEAGVPPAEPLVLVLPGGAWPTKLVPVETLIAAVRPLAAEGIRPVLVWGNAEERRLAEAIAAGLGEPPGAPRPVVMPKLTLAGLAALGARVTLTVGGDTGPLYVAAAQGSATVSVFGPTPAGRTAPRGPAHVAVQGAPPCGPCFRRRCPTGHFICLPGVDPADVTAAARRVLGRTGAGPRRG
ncbi:MAG TPA: glycosyltransferase family 9 protein [Thermodesulfobacteriota bacterium]